ncbi:MAG TPA: UbiD family decarboxylase, partial [Turneriella sp.]|nr:UbiD family decarboxylase [Turneriella sp.]
EEGVPLKASVLVGGPPALILAAVMPLPETISEILFASMLGKRSFKYKRRGGYLLSPFVDFAIHGEISNQMLPEGPFGDHLGYYSLKHDFPHLKVDKILVRKKNAIWPFTVVGRPPQEDSEFGALIHSLTKDLISHEVPGVREVNAVDAAGVHPLLLAVGSERYLPYAEKKPREILTQANAILGFNQMSLAKYLFITAEEGSVKLSTHRVEDFLVHILERIDLTRDLHFQTCTTMDSLDYSGHALHEGSKLIVAAYGEKRRTLATVLPERAMKRYTFRDARLALAGVIVVRTTAFKDYKSTEYEMRSLGSSCREFLEEGIVLIVVADDAEYTAKNLDNFLWTTFTRSDPARDIYGVDSFTENKHWGAKGAIIIDARVKHHHAGMLVEDAAVSENINRFFKKGASLEKFH